ncbi:Type-1 restriction enzyme EcoKI specificity protein [compost metagenome]
MKKYTLGNICYIQSGGTPDRTVLGFYNSPDIPWAKVGDLEEGKSITKTEEFISYEGLKSIGNRVFEKGTVLLALYGSTLGKTCISDIKLSCNQAVLTLSSKDNNILDNTYLKYWFDFNKERIVFKQKGGAQKNLNADYIKKLEIVLPSISYQRKTVALLEQIQTVISDRIKTIDILDEYLKNIFLEMFLENPLFEPKSNYWGKIIDVVKESIYGTATKANSERKGIPVIRMNNITYKGEIDIKDLKWVELRSNEIDKLELNNGDILFNRTNSKDLVGKTAVWENGNGFTFAGYLIKLIINEEMMTPHYFADYMNSHFGKRILFYKGKSSGSQVNFSASLLKTQKILIPPIEMQLQYEKMHRNVKAQKQSFKKSLNLLKELFQSVLNETFKDNSENNRDEIDLLIADEIRLELFLNTFLSADFQNEDLYSIEIERLFTILERTSQTNKVNSDNKKGIIQRLENAKIVLEANREYKNRLIDEAITS